LLAHPHPANPALVPASICTVVALVVPMRQSGTPLASIASLNWTYAESFAQLLASARPRIHNR
jgi:hypothetical protein